MKPTNYRPLLSVEKDAKTVKGTDQGFLTGILYLAPYNLSGVVNVCVNASPGCIASCLFTAGLASVHSSINVGRIAKTRYMVADPVAFRESLAYDIARLERKAMKRGLVPAVRINGTSDLPKLAREMALRFPNVQFYDYTKLGKAWLRELPNYSLTFSHSELNLSDCLQALAHGVNVAVVFGLKKGTAMPETWHGYRVVNGDESDLRFIDPKGCVIGLYAKGQAKHDTTGFVDRLVNIELGKAA